MRAIAHKRFEPGFVEGGAVDGYVVEDLVADRGHDELVCDAAGPHGEPVTLVVAWRRPPDRHAWPRFRRWARTRAALEHEALLPVRSFGNHSGRPYLVMERYPDETLEDLLDGAPLPPRQALMLLAPVCAALDLAHANGLVHESLSGASLLVRHEALVLDGFGLAGGPRELTFDSVGVHEVRYCPPEELRGEPLEASGNVYSLTALLVHALTGEPPYQGTPAAQAYAHLMEPPPVPSAHMPQLGTGFDEVVARGMAKEPAERPASAGELLREAAAALGVELPTRAVPGEAAESDRRHPAAVRSSRVRKAAVAAAVIVAALAGGAAGAVLDPFGNGGSAAPPSADARALERLGDQRTPLRARLADGETPQEQSDAAAELADAYGRAADTAESPRLVAAARTAERAYEDLAEAAGAGSAERFADASDLVARADSRLGSSAP